MDDVVRAVLVGGSGIFTRAQARRSGLSDAQVTRAVRRREIVRLAPGVYGRPTEGTPEQRHATAARAALAAIGEGAYVSHYSALACADLPTYGCDLATEHLCSARARWRRGGLTMHGLPHGVSPRGTSVPLAVALLQTGLVAGPTAFSASADAALRSGAVSRGEIERALALMSRWPGIAAIRTAATRLDPRAESVGESVARELLHHLGWSTEPQYAVATAGRRYRADLRIHGEQVLVEFDGMGKYADSRALAVEKRREADLRAAGWEIVRLVWSDLRDAERVRRLVAAAVRRGPVTASVS